MLAVILGGVEVTGHTPRLHFLEQISSLRKCPWPTVETLDNTTEKRPRGDGVRLLRLTRARHCRSEGRYWSINKLRNVIIAKNSCKKLRNCQKYIRNCFKATTVIITLTLLATLQNVKLCPEV